MFIFSFFQNIYCPITTLWTHWAHDLKASLHRFVFNSFSHSRWWLVRFSFTVDIDHVTGGAINGVSRRPVNDRRPERMRQQPATACSVTVHVNNVPLINRIIITKWKLLNDIPGARYQTGDHWATRVRTVTILKTKRLQPAIKDPLTSS